MPRESQPKRHHSRFPREPSPKRSRRNGKPTMERSPNRQSPEIRDKDGDRKHHHRLPDPLPLEKPHASESKHNDRSNASHNGTSTARGGKSERGWGRSNEDDRRGRYQASSNALEKDEKSIARKDDTRVRRHETDADQSQPTKKKFREEKVPPAESQLTEKAAAEPVKTAQLEGAVARSGRREERGIHRYPDRNERDRGYAGGRFPPNRARAERAAFPSRDRYQDRFRGREGYTGRQGYSAGGGGRVEKWKHDLFDEVNKGTSNEEDPVAKAEALLAL